MNFIQKSMNIQIKYTKFNLLKYIFIKIAFLVLKKSVKYYIIITYKFRLWQRSSKMAPRNMDTQMFRVPSERDDETKRILQEIYNALSERGYNPINQIVGYIISEDPTYITNHNNARALIRKLDRDELLAKLLKNYLDI